MANTRNSFHSIHDPINSKTVCFNYDDSWYCGGTGVHCSKQQSSANTNQSSEALKPDAPNNSFLNLYLTGIGRQFTFILRQIHVPILHPHASEQR